MSSDDGNQVVGIKVEEVADLIWEEDPGPTTSPLIKTEQLVRCVSVFRHNAQLSKISCLSVCFLSVEGFSEHGSQLSGTVAGREFLD
jgi:hypothetical protein